MKILKRNQLIVLVISLMLITAGYLNFTSQENNNILPTSDVVAELGDATLVSSIPITNESEGNNISNEAENSAIGEAASENNIQTIVGAGPVSAHDSKNEQTVENTIETINQQEDSYFTTSKLERESMYSQMLETYQEIYNNTGASAQQRAEALAEIAKINSTKNAIMIAENLISAKGFQKVVVFSNTNSVSVIIGKEELQPEEIAQIQNIVSRELNVTVDIIHISTK